MKRFIVISLLSALSLPMLACGWEDNHNNYLFSMYDNMDFKSRVEKICNDNWKAYLGSTAEWYYFNAEDVMQAARQKGDALMVSYVENLQKYLKCVGIEQNKQWEWNYPSKEDLAQQKADLQAVRAYALGKTKTKLRSQHALLYMRCNMMLGRHQENVTYWEQTASQFIETVYKDMMKNIYAGALYKTGQEDKAGELFAEMGDFESLMTQYYKKRSYLAIQQEYKKNPNAKVLPFLLQDFVNNTQEAIDLQNGTYGGKLFIRDISKQEAWQMRQFCDLVVREGKTETPILWKSAKAWIEFLWGEQKEAAQDIVAAMSLEGTDRMKECTRELMLYITAAQAKPGEAFDDYLADELSWLLERKGNHDDHTYSILDRLSHQVLYKRYDAEPSRKAGLIDLIEGYSTSYLDTIEVEKAERYLMYRNTPAKNKLDKLLKAKSLSDEEQKSMEELIGTKYMRLCQWDKAIEWLKNVPIDFYNEHRSSAYRYYSSVRQWNVEPWIKRQWVNESEAYEKDLKWWKHRKLDFCKEMQMMEASLNLLKGKALEQRYYNLATYYAQANIKGDCWWLLHNAKSAYDGVGVNEVDFGAKAVEMLQKAAMTSDPDLKLKALFALGYRELYKDDGYDFDPSKSKSDLWRSYYWNNETGEYNTAYNRQSPQFRAYQAVFDLVDDEPEEPMYISKCDEFLQFRKYYRQHK
ncbi:MAG: hypothetical protein IJ569_04735 [Prevotella sp.]|nr:hypothetical protein [Prevotella sp.]